MATKVLSNEFMQNIATEEAWKELSSNFSWSEAMLESIRTKLIGTRSQRTETSDGPLQ